MEIEELVAATARFSGAEVCTQYLMNNYIDIAALFFSCVLKGGLSVSKGCPVCHA